ncbi:hypothetical protein [Mobilicoccus sp.]|uniref:hypothetical protein n=2 Tax=Mobilicoccus sp. TaxID=2034349 RepID=UPI0028A1E9E1|nr:hypothetical protein [Mobilicoccus sp.]
MTALHIVLLACSAGLVAAVVAGQQNLARRGADLPLMGGIVGGALVLGNAACLLPTAPRWYQVAMVALTAAGFVWYLVSVASASRETAPAAGVGVSGRDHLRTVPALRATSATGAGSSSRTTGASDERLAARPVATQATFASAGPAPFTTGQTYVAAHIDAYVDARGTRRAHGRFVPRSHSAEDPTARFLRLAEAYGVDRGPRHLGRSAHA